MRILGIETSCDETAAAVVQDHPNPSCRILSNCIFSQIAQHQDYGGVVPELAARAHLKFLLPTIRQAVSEAGLFLNDVDAIAATAGPGLIGGVLVGLMAAKALALSLNKPFLAINHLEGHALTPRLSHKLEFPYVLLLVSGGHCQFLEVEDLGRYRLLGTTMDDAAGEAFDKVAQLLGLEYPGGPSIEKMADKGDPDRFVFPIPLKGRAGCNLSFSGLKTAVRTLVKNLPSLEEQDKKDIAACFQKAMVSSLTERSTQALKALSQPVKHFVVAGGVAANQALRQSLQSLCKQYHLEFIAPPLSLCTDNAAMIAWVGLERLKRGEHSSLEASPLPRWPLQDLH